MIDEALRPRKLFDLAGRMEEYLAAFRRIEKSKAPAFAAFLAGTIDESFANLPLDKLDLKKTTVEIVDEMYDKILHFERIDNFTKAYFGAILSGLFRQLKANDIRAFYILDNSIRDDRFKLVVDLYKEAGFAVVCPYKLGKLGFSPDHTRWPAIELRQVEARIEGASNQGEHILYVEKDDSVNYLTNVLTVAESLQSKYVCIFRNQAVDSKKSATWLAGSFGNILTR